MLLTSLPDNINKTPNELIILWKNIDQRAKDICVKTDMVRAEAYSFVKFKFFLLFFPFVVYFG